MADEQTIAGCGCCGRCCPPPPCVRVRVPIDGGGCDNLGGPSSSQYRITGADVDVTVPLVGPGFAYAGTFTIPPKTAYFQAVGSTFGSVNGPCRWYATQLRVAFSCEPSTGSYHLHFEYDLVLDFDGADPTACTPAPGNPPAKAVFDASGDGSGGALEELACSPFHWLRRVTGCFGDLTAHIYCSRALAPTTVVCEPRFFYGAGRDPIPGGTAITARVDEADCGSVTPPPIPAPEPIPPAPTPVPAPTPPPIVVPPPVVPGPTPISGGGDVTPPPIAVPEPVAPSPEPVPPPAVPPPIVVPPPVVPPLPPPPPTPPPIAVPPPVVPPPVPCHRADCGTCCLPDCVTFHATGRAGWPCAGLDVAGTACWTTDASQYLQDASAKLQTAGEGAYIFQFAYNGHAHVIAAVCLEYLPGVWLWFIYRETDGAPDSGTAGSGYSLYPCGDPGDPGHFTFAYDTTSLCGFNGIIDVDTTGL